MNRWGHRWVVCVGLLIAWLAGGGVVPASAQASLPQSTASSGGGTAATAPIPILKDVGVDQKLGSQIPLDAEFVDSTGKTVKLGQYFGQRPVILVLAYYQCPMLCTQVIHAVASSMIPLSFNAGKDFDVVVVSFDPGETPSMAKAKRDDFIERYRRPGTDDGIHFLTGRQGPITALTDAVGFRYAYDKKIDQYAHPAVITLLTPQGRVSRYLFGIDYAPRDLKFSLMKASSNELGSVVDQAILFCYHYDPSTGRYGFAIMTAVRIGGVITLAGLGGFILVALRRDRRQHKTVKSTATGSR